MVWGQPDTKPAVLLGGNANANAASAGNSAPAAPTAASIAAKGASKLVSSNVGATKSKTTTTAPKAAAKAKLATAEEIDLFENVKRVNEIHLEGVAVLQILKHCHENLPNLVTGSLLGMESTVDGESKAAPTLEITNSFPSTSKDGNKGDDSSLEVMKRMREVNMDNNKVGWYQSALLGNFVSASVIQSQFRYQKALGPNAVCIIYDPMQSANSTLSLKAFRLTESFFQLYKKGSFTTESLAKMDIRSPTILEEIPIKISNPDIINVWLGQRADDKMSEFDRLELSSSDYLENSLRNLLSWAEELQQENNKLQSYDRYASKQRQQYAHWLAKRREENKIRVQNGEEPLPEENPAMQKNLHQPNRLESLLITKQINVYCQQINRYAGASFEKLFLAGSMHKEN